MMLGSTRKEVHRIAQLLVDDVRQKMLRLQIRLDDQLADFEDEVERFNAVEKGWGQVVTEQRAQARHIIAVDHSITAVEGAVRALGETLLKVAERVAIVETSEGITALEAECQAKAETIRQLQDELAASERVVIQTSTGPENVSIDTLIERYNNQRRSLQNLRSDEVVPTYTDSKGKTHQLREMPTPYLTNILQLLMLHGLDGRYGRRGSGLATAIREELLRRSAEAQQFAAGDSAD